MPGSFRSTVYSALFACAMFGFALVSVLPAFLGLPSRPFSVAYRALILGVSLVFVLARLQRESRFDASPKSTWFVLLLWALLALRMLWDNAITPLPMALPWGEYWLLFLGSTIAPALVFLWTVPQVCLIRTRALCEFAGALTVGLLITLGVLFILRSDGILRFRTEILNPISMGHVAVSASIVLGAGIAAQLQAGRKQRGRLLLRLLAAAASVGLVLASASKGPILALLAVLSVSSVVVPVSDDSRRLSQIGRRFFRLSAILAFVAGATILLREMTPIDVIGRFTGALFDLSTTLRTRMMAGALSQFAENPWLGSSFVELSERFYPHNIIVEVLMATGVLGFCALFLLLICSAFSCYLVLTRLPDCRWLGLLYIQYLVDCMVSGSLYFSSQFWVVLLAVLAAGRLARQDGTSPVRSEGGSTSLAG